MNYKNVVDNWIGFISGVWGGGTSYTLMISWHDEVFKLAIAGVTALIAGAMGVAGKYLFVSVWKKVRSLKFKK